MGQFNIPNPIPRYSLEVAVSNRGPYGPHDVYLGGTLVAVREYDGSDHAEIVAEFARHLTAVAIAGKPLWTVSLEEGP